MNIPAKIHNVVDFKQSPLYNHLQLVHKNFNDEQILEIVLSQDENKFVCIENSFTVSGATKIDIPLSRYCPDYQGIYDITLKNCANVSSVVVSFKNVDVEIPCKEGAEEIQIPLAFTGKVERMFFEPNRTSFIPTVGLHFDVMSIKLNEGASCDVCLSTVHFGKTLKTHIVCSNIVFYINGEQFVTKCGEVWPYKADDYCSSCSMM